MDDDRRWALRRGIELEGHLTDSAGLSLAVRVTDISEVGCMIRLPAGAHLAGDRVHAVKVPGLDALSGSVVWCSAGKAGLAFSEPLLPETVQNLVMKSHYARISRNMAQNDAPEDHLPPLRPFPFAD